MSSGGSSAVPLGKCVDVNNYERIAQIGEGTYGLVFMARDKRTGQIVALKKVRMEREHDGMPVTALREMRLLARSMHPHIVRLRGVVSGARADAIFLVFDYAEHDLAALLDAAAAARAPRPTRRPRGTARSRCHSAQCTATPSRAAGACRRARSRRARPAGPPR